jgi:hypothetical protein
MIAQLPRRPETNLSHGPRWKAVISRYIATMPVSGDTPCAPAQRMSAAPPPRTDVSSAMSAKVGAAARLSQSAARTAIVARGTAGPDLIAVVDSPVGQCEAV